MTNQTEPTYPPHIDHDEIELIDYLRVIWKWKYLIVVGTLVCGLIAAVISLNMPKIFLIEMTLRAVVADRTGNGEMINVNYPNNIKVKIWAYTQEI